MDQPSVASLFNYMPVAPLGLVYPYILPDEMQ